MCTHTCIPTYSCLYKYIHKHSCAHIHIYVHTNMGAHLHTHVGKHMHTCAHTHIHMHMQTYRNIHVHTCTHSHIQTCEPMQTRTHTPQVNQLIQDGRLHLSTKAEAMNSAHHLQLWVCFLKVSI